MIGNVLTIDVEDWFHLLDLPVPGFGRAQWDTLPSRVDDATRRILDILERHGAGATFFVLGWVASRHPRLVADIHARGFEVASHGFGHQLVSRLSRAGLADDLRDSLAAISDATGAPVTGYRAPGFSITSECTWAFEVLAEHGITHDSSVFPGRHGHGGMRTRHRAPYTLATRAGDVVELPIATVDVLGRSFSVGGGGYMRLLPGAVMRGCLRFLGRTGTPATVYLHPRDLDAEQPRIPGLPLSRRFKSYVGLRGTEAKLHDLLVGFRFTSIRDLLAEPAARASIAAVRESVP